MKTIILFGLLGATMSAPIIPQRLLSASNSNELLLNLNTAQLQPLQLQSLFNSWISPFSGIQQQQQAQIPGLSLFALSPLDQFARLFPNQITFPGQVSFAQKTQVGQLDPLQPPTPPHAQQGHDHAHLITSEESPLRRIPRTPESPGHYDVVLQYYPIYMLLPWEQPQQTVTPSPPQTGQQQFEEQIPFYTQYGYIPQQAEHIIPGQQQLTFDTFIGTAPETAVVPAEGVISYLPKEILNFKPASGGLFISSPSQKPSTTNSFASTIDPTITPEFMEEQAKTGSLKEP